MCVCALCTRSSGGVLFQYVYAWQFGSYVGYFAWNNYMITVEYNTQLQLIPHEVWAVIAVGFSIDVRRNPTINTDFAPYISRSVQ